MLACSMLIHGTTLPRKAQYVKEGMDAFRQGPLSSAGRLDFQ
jgi:hypothetical protein